ncbi:MAG: hypothetical protein AAF665_14005 [Pseudomonadota bacterium]
MTDTSDKISIEEWEALVDSEFTTDAELLTYSRVVSGQYGFNLGLEPDPDRVEVPKEWYTDENAMRMANNRERRKRERKFEKRIKQGDTSPVIVTEMDSWGQFPLLIHDVVDYLNDNGYNCWSMGAAGDTARNMVYGPMTRGGQEYMLGLNDQKSLARAFVFSAAGNDIIGEDPDTGVPTLSGLVKDFNGDVHDVAGHINHGAVASRLAELSTAYQRVIDTIRSDPAFRCLPIIIHGYDIPFPYPWDSKDRRTPVYVLGKGDKWLGSVFKDKKIPNDPLGRAILVELINSLYEMLYDLAGNSRKSHVWVVNCRGALPKVTDWNDEIHGTTAGYAKVTGRFLGILNHAIKHAENV